MVDLGGLGADLGAQAAGEETVRDGLHADGPARSRRPRLGRTARLRLSSSRHRSFVLEKQRHRQRLRTESQEAG